MFAKWLKRLRTAGKSSDLMIARWMLIIRPAVVTATLGTAILIYPKGLIDKVPLAIIVFGTYLLTLLYLLAHRLSGVNRPLLATQIAFDLFIITVIIHYTGGISSSFIGFYFLSIMCVSLFFRRLVAFLFSTLAVVFYVSYSIMYMYYIVPRLGLAVEGYIVSLQAIMYSALMYGVGFLSSGYAERIIKKDTALLSALKLLKEARLDTSDILQSMTNGLITVNMSGYIVYLNRAAASILHIKHVEAQGRKYSEVLGKRAGELTEVIDRELARASGTSEKEINVFDEIGNSIPLGLTAVPLCDTDRSRRGVILNFKDLTEKNKLIEMIRQSDKMAAIGELSAAIAHEIRNPLASISNAAEFLKENSEKKESRVTKLFDIIEKESERLQRISTDFLRFARVKNPKISKLNLKKIIEEIVILIENDPNKTKNVAIINNINNDLHVQFDEDHLKQLLINILINSLEAMAGHGEILIKVENDKQIDIRFVRLVIHDTGPGFPEEALGRVFEPFFSTKKEGTGLGLTMVSKLLISNHGRVLAQNKKPHGAEIALDLPLHGVE